MKRSLFIETLAAGRKGSWALGFRDYLHLQRAQPSDGGHRSQTGLGGYGQTLAESRASLRDHTVSSIESAAIVRTVGVHVDYKRGPQRGVGAHRRQPQNAHEQIEGEDCPDVVRVSTVGRLLGYESVCDYDQGEKTLRGVSLEYVAGITTGKPYANQSKDNGVHHQTVHQYTAQYHDQEAEEGLETADDGAPDRRMDHEHPATTSIAPRG